MKLFGLLATALVCSACATATPNKRASAWSENMHHVGETMPSLAQTQKLLGPPDSTKTLVTTGGEYAPLQPLYCKKLPAGVKLDVLQYQEGNMLHLLYFNGAEMQCRAFEFKQRGSES